VTARPLLAACALLLLAACQTSSTPQPHSEIVRHQLTQVLSRHDAACGAVNAYARIGLLDYRVQCANGAAYRVRVDGRGQVVVTPA
jgi:hypothetical protein